MGLLAGGFCACRSSCLPLFVALVHGSSWHVFGYGYERENFPGLALSPLLQVCYLLFGG